MKGKSPKAVENSMYHNKADRKADSVSTPKPKRGDSRSKQTMGNIKPQAPAGKYHG